MALRILIVDDEPRICRSLEKLIRDEGHAALSCNSGERGIEIIREYPMDVVFLDVVLPGMDGLDTLKQLMQMSPKIKVLMMSGRADLSIAVRATKMGAHNFFEKPLNPDRILLELSHISDQMHLEKKVASLEHHMETEEMIGECEAMRQLRHAIKKAAPTNGRVLIVGENGTGKELVAQAIHRLSLRNEKPFVSLNCAALPENLVESELFGYEKGAFTGALHRKQGRFEIADEGTLFLDEVGDMSLDIQAKLLRVLEENEAVRVGGNSPYRFDVRIISATNKDLAKEIAQNRFREDLFYRLNVIPIDVPPLRFRKEDVSLLAGYFLKTMSERMGKGMMTWANGSLEILESYPWPGNVRELKNFVERMIIMGEGKMIPLNAVAKALSLTPDSIQSQVDAQHDESMPFRERVLAFEKEILRQGYEEVGGNVSALARKLKIDRANLHRKLKAYGIFLNM